MISLLHRFSRLFFAVLFFAAPGAALAQATFSAQFSPDSISSGNNSTLTFTITEVSASPASDLAFSATLPAGVSIASGSQSNSCDGTFTATAGGTAMSLSGGRLGASQSCTVSLPVTSSTVGTHSFTTGDLTSSQGNSGTATDDLAVTAASGTGYSKSFSPAAVDPGSTATLTYTFDVTVAASPGFSDYRDPAFSETLPAGLSFPSPVTTSSSCGGTLTVDRDAGTLDFDGPTLTTAGTTSCTITAQIRADTPGSYSLENGLIVRNPFFTTISQDTASAGLTVSSPPADSLGLIKAFDVTQANAGGSATLEFTLSNTSRSNSAANVAFSDDLDAFLSGTTFSSLNSNSCGGSVSGAGSSSLSFSGGSLAAEASCTISAEISLDAGAADGTYTNTTSAVTGDLGGSSVTGSTASTTLRVLGADAQPPAFSKDFTDDPVAPGGTVTAQYTLTNPNTGQAVSDIAFSDTLSLPTGQQVTGGTGSVCGGTLGLSLVDDDFQLNFSGGSLAAGASCTIPVTILVPEGTAPAAYTSSTNDLSATVNGNTVGTSGASATLTVSGGANLSFVKEFTQDIAGAGSDTELTFTLSSAAESTSTATALAFTDDLDAFLSGTTFSSLTSDSCGGSLTGSSTLSYSGGTLDPGESCQVILNVSLSAGAANGTYTNTTSALSATAGGQATTVSAASDSLQVITAQPLQTSKSFAPASALPGETVTLTYTLTNPDSSAGYTGGFFTDSYSTALTSLAAVNAPPAVFTNCGGAPSSSGTTFGIFSGLDIAAGASCTIAVDLLVPAGAADGSYNSLSSNLTATVNSASVSLPAMQANLEVDSAQLLLSKSYTDDPVAPGGTVTAQYTLSNLSSSAATAIAFTDDLDAALSGLVSSSGTLSNPCGAGSSVSGTSTLNLTGASLAAGGSCTFSVFLSVPVGAAAAAHSGSTSAVSGTISGLAATGPAAAATLSVNAFSLPGFSKSFADPALAAGGSTTLTYVITNTDSSSTLTGLRFSDDLNAALSGLAVTGGTGSNLCGSGSSVAGSSTVSLTAGTLAPGESCSIPLTVTVPSAAAADSYSSSSGTLTENGSFAAAAAAAAFTVEPAPGFAKAFGNASIAQDGSTTLTLTVDNSASAIAASALDVTDILPAGLVLASPSNAATTCTGGTLTATAGAATLSYTGGTAAAGASCTITADVTSSTAGSYSNTTGDLSSSSGNSGTASANLNVIGLTVNTPFTADNILIAPEAAALTVSGNSTQIEDGRTVTVTVTDSAAAQVSGTASISGNAWSLTLDLSGLADGDLSLTADASDAAGTAANQVSENLTKNAEAPAGYSAAFDQDPVTADNESAASFTFAGAETGSSYVYTISSDGGGSDVTGSGTIATATDQIAGLDLSGLGDGTLTLSVVLTDTAGNAGAAETGTAAKDAAVPAGYSAAFDQDPVTAANQNAASFTFAGAETGSSYAYTISSDGGGSDVTGSGTIATATDQIAGLDLSGLGDGTLTLSVVLTDAAGNAGATEAGTAAKDASAPAGYSAAFDQSAVNAANQSAISFTFTDAETGSSYAYTISSDGGGSDVTGSGTIATATDQIAGLDLSGLGDGTLTLSVVLTDAAGNTGAAETSTVAKGSAIPSLSFNSPQLEDDMVSAAEAAAVALSGSSTLIEDGQTVTVTVTDSTAAQVSGTASISGNAWNLTLDLSGLADGALALTADASDTLGNAASQATASADKDTAAPSGYSVSFDQSAVNAANQSAVSFTFASAQTGSNYAYTISSDSGGSDVTGSGTIATATDQIAGLDLSGLGDGTLTLTVVLTDAAGNAGTAETSTAAKDTTAPAGYSVSFDQSAVNAANESAVSFTFAGAETGSSYAYTISSDGGGSDVTGSGTIATATDQIAGLDLSGLGDGTLTLSVVLTDTAGNATAATASAEKEASLPTAALSGPDTAQSDPFEVTLQFSEAVTGLSLDGLEVTGGSASDLTGSDASYSVTVTPDHDGTLTIQLSTDAAQDLAGNGNEASDILEATAELTGTPNPVPPADLDGDGIPDSFESATADRDGDGIPDAQDYDPQGYFYCEDDGRILTGGGLTVTGPSGSNSSLGIANDINIVRDGSTGEYQWFAQRPGTYTVAYSYPAGGAASTVRLSSGSLDVTSLLPANPAVLGSTQVGSTGALADASHSANPVFYDTFVIEAGDPNVLANNIPMTQCAANAVTVSAADDGAEANGGVPDDAGFTISLERASTVDTVLSYSLSGTATAGADYTAPSGSVTVPAGDTNAEVTVTVLEDQLIEGSETLILTLTAVTSGDGAASLSTTASELTGTASLADDDFAIVAVTNDDLTASENGEDTAAMSFRLLGQPGQDVQLAFTGDSQCTVSPASMSFSAANFATAQVLTISAIDDEEVEGTHSCQPAVTVSSADTRYDGFALTLAQVQVSDDLVDQIRDQLTAVLKKDLEETIKTQQRYFSRIAKGALERLQAGQEGLRCGTVAAFDVDGSLQVQGGTGNSAGSFGWDVYNCGSGRREILDGAFTLSRTDGLGTQAMLQFSRQSERFLPEQALRGRFWGGYVSRTSADGLADGSITGFGANAGIYGARALNEGLFLDYYAAAALGHHRYRLRFETATDPIHARGGYTYAAGFAGAALSGRHQLENMLISPRLGADLAFAEADDASVTATQLSQRDTGRIDIPGYNGGRIFAEVEFANLAAAEDSSPAGGLAARLSFAPRLACESSSYDGTTGCGAGFVFARDVYDPSTGLRYGFEIDYEYIDGTDRLALDVHRERPFAGGQGAVVTRITAPDADSLKIEHGIRLDF